MPELFISYSRRDTAFVQGLIKALNENGYSSDDIWVDWEDIPASSKWENEIENGIQSVNSVIFVLSPSWVASRECAKELDYAAKYNKRLFPVIWQNVDPKAVQGELAAINWIFLRESDSFDKGLQTLLEALQVDLDWVQKHTRYLALANEWERKERDSGSLLRGAALLEAEQWLTDAGTDPKRRPTPLQTEYIIMSRKEETNRQRRNVLSVSVALVVSIFLAISAVVAGVEASRQGQIALASQLAAQSTNLVYTQPDTSLLLSLEANYIGDQLGESDPAWLGSLLTSLNASPHLGMYLRQHEASVRGLAFSPDGKWLASAGEDNHVILWNTTKAQTEPHKVLKDAQQRVLAVVFSRDGRYLFAAGKERIIFVWDMEQDAKLLYKWALKDGQGDVRALGILTLNNRELVAVASGSQVFFWDIQTGALIPSRTLKLAQDASIQSMDVTKDSNRLAVGSNDGSVTAWDVRAKTILFRKCSVGVSENPTDQGICQELEDGPTEVRGVAFNPDGTLLVSGSSEPYARLWDVSTGEQLALSPESSEGGHSNSVTSVTFNGNDEVITASWDNTVRVWKLDLERKQFLLDNVLYGHSNSIWTVVANPQGNLFASGSSDQSVIVWKMDQLNQIGHEVAKLGKDVWALAVSPGWDQVAAGDGTGHIQLWDFDGEQLKDALSLEHPGGILTLAFSPDDRLLISAGGGRDIIAWDRVTGKPTWTIPDAHAGDVWSVAFSPNGRYLASAGYDQQVKIWNAETGEPVSEPVAFDRDVYALAFNRDGSQLLVAGYDEQVHVLDFSVEGVATRSKELQGHGAAVNSLSFNPHSSSILASTSDDKTLLIWNVEREQATEPVMGFSESMEAVTFHPYGDELASATNNKTVLLWKWDTACITTWDTAKCQPARLGSPLVGHRTQVQNVLFLSPTKLLSSSEDGQLILWDLNRSRWYEQACTIVNDTWDAEEQSQYTDGKLNSWLLNVRSWWLKQVKGENPPAAPSCLTADPS